jgi:minor extracellular serine protease Vpr
MTTETVVIKQKTKFYSGMILMFLVLSHSTQGQVRRLEQVEATSPETRQCAAEPASFWFVELTSPPAADGTSLAQLQSEKASFRAAAKAAGLRYTERYAFDSLWNGLSVRVNRNQVAALGRVAGVKTIYPVGIIERPRLEMPDALQLLGSTRLTVEKNVKNNLGYSGAGIKVGVIDTGIDVDHPAFGGDGVARKNSPLFPTERIAYGYDFVGDAFDAGLNPVPDPNPDDDNFEGTHLAGIIGANGFTKGVAPGVIFGAYKIFGDGGASADDIQIAAMERALADGMQVVVIGWGSAWQWPEYPTARAADRLVSKGVVVVAPTGGSPSLYSLNAPGVGKKVIGVTCFDNTYGDTYRRYLEVNGRKIGFREMQYSGPVPFSGDGEIVYAGLGCATVEADLAGKIVLMSRGNCPFSAKAANAIAAGAKAVLIHNNIPGDFSGTLGTVIDGKTPVVAISLEDGLFIRAQEAPVMMAWSDGLLTEPNPTSGLISSWAGYGLSPDLTLKPDLGAPGSPVFSTVPIELGSYLMWGGSLSAAGVVAGAAALLLEAQPHLPAEVVRDVLQNSAVPAPWRDDPSLGYLDNVHRQGAGMLHIDDSLRATTLIRPGKISAGEGQAGPHTERLTVENKGTTPVTYKLDYVNALSTGGLIQPDFWISDASVSFSSAILTIPAGGKACVDTTITPATAPQYGLYGGYIRFTPNGGGQVYRVPFAGFVGDYQGIKLLPPIPPDDTWPIPAIWFRGENGWYEILTGPNDWTFTMEWYDLPYLEIPCEHQCRRLRVEIFAWPSGKAWHRAFETEYVGLPSVGEWDGYTVNGGKVYQVPDGQYVMKLSMLKALGDDKNPADWEAWTSPVFVIKRPK